MAEVYSKAGEHVVILGTREAYIQPFDAPNWVDLRVGFFLSLTQADPVDDTTTGLAETISNTIPPNGHTGVYPTDRYWIGLKTGGKGSTLMPRTSGVVFAGFTNSMHNSMTPGEPGESLGDTVLGTTGGTSYWVPSNSLNAQWCAGICDGGAWRTGDVAYQQQFFAQDATAVAAGYATLLAIRLTRVSPGLSPIMMSMKAVAGTGSNLLFSNTPTVALIESNLRAFSNTVGSYGPVQVSNIPDCLYFYWPFRNSRLRVHSIGVFKNL